MSLVVGLSVVLLCYAEQTPRTTTTTVRLRFGLPRTRFALCRWRTSVLYDCHASTAVAAAASRRRHKQPARRRAADKVEHRARRLRACRRFRCSCAGRVPKFRKCASCCAEVQPLLCVCSQRRCILAFVYVVMYVCAPETPKTRALCRSANAE